MLLQQIRSKEADFDISGNGFATFYYDNGSPSTPTPGLAINYLNSTNYTAIDAPYGICCTSPLRLGQPVVATKTNNNFGLTIYPNPTLADGWIAIDASFSDDEPSANITVSDLSGKQLFSKQLNIINKKINHTLSVAAMNLAKGIYFIQLETKHYTKTNKLIIY